MVLTSSNLDKAFLDLQSMFKNTNLSKIEELKNQYNQIYRDFENKGLSLISGKKSVEITRRLVKKLNESEKNKYKDELYFRLLLIRKIFRWLSKIVIHCFFFFFTIISNN